MIHIPSNHTSISPSREFIEHQTSLMMIAIYAKLTNNMDIFNQAKEIHDEFARRFNEQNRPKKKGFWEEFKDNFFLNMDTTSFTPAEFLDENSDTFSVWYEMEKSKSQAELQGLLKWALSDYNSKYGK